MFTVSIPATICLIHSTVFINRTMLFNGVVNQPIMIVGYDLHTTVSLHIGVHTGGTRYSWAPQKF